jgi:hypothetical protein
MHICGKGTKIMGRFARSYETGKVLHTDQRCLPFHSPLWKLCGVLRSRREIGECLLCRSLTSRNQIYEVVGHVTSS